MYFNFKTNDRGELIYKRVSCDLVNAIRDLKKELQKACIAIEEKNVAAQVNEVNKRKRAALEACIDAAIRELKSISVAQADKFRRCGVCANYRYEVASKGHCK